MGKDLVVLLGTTLLLSSCSGYFDRHPANVRPESEAVATVLAHQRPAVGVLSAPVTVGPAPPAQVTQTELPTPALPVPKRVVARSSGTPPELPSATRGSTEPANSVAAMAISPGAPAGTGRVSSAPIATPVLQTAPVAKSKPPRVSAPQYESAAAPQPSPAVAAIQSQPATQIKPPHVSAPQYESGPIRAPQPSPPVAAIQSQPVTQIEPPRVSAPRYEPAPITAPQPSPPIAAIQSQPVSEGPEANPPLPSRVYAPPPSQPAPIVAMHPVPETSATPVAVPGPPAASSTFGSDMHCEAVARQRADDAAASGLDRNTQEIVLRGAFADCVAWDRAHPASMP